LFDIYVIIKISKLMEPTKKRNDHFQIFKDAIYLWSFFVTFSTTLLTYYTYYLQLVKNSEVWLAPMFLPSQIFILTIFLLNQILSLVTYRRNKILSYAFCWVTTSINIFFLIAMLLNITNPNG
jgi:hypothetical protein